MLFKLNLAVSLSDASVAQWLARSAVNRKVGGSSPPGGEYNFRLTAEYRLNFILGILTHI